ncbi:hypothetical protein FALBO_6980, partial [Fusarium albosuccineum]
DRKDYNSAGLEDMYKKHLLHVSKNTHLLSGKDGCRIRGTRRQRRAARCPQGVGWHEDSHTAWVEEIAQSKEDYGFIIYKSREVENRSAVAKERWFQVWNGRKMAPGIDIDLLDDNFPSYKNAGDWVYNGFFLNRHMLPLWVSPCPEHGFSSEQTRSAFRE